MFRSVPLAALFAFSALGCGRESQIDRKPVYGNIVGAEGRNGVVTFTPIDTTIGPAATRSFEDGAYRFSEDDGPVPGEYEVTVEFVASPGAKQSGLGGGRGPGGRRLVSKNPVEGGRLAYEQPMTTTATVPADGPFKIDLHPTESESQ